MAMLLAVYMWWVVASFDTMTPPARLGRVDAQLFTRATRNAPLIVGLGGAEGGNAWASQRWRTQRERLIEQGHAVLATGYFGLPNTPRLIRAWMDAASR